MSTKVRRFLIGLVIVVVILAIALPAAGVVWVKTTAPKSFPQVDGDIQLNGLDGPVDVYRDGMGVPHIYAGTLHDLFMAQGYVHAQERFWQMDFWRRIGSGRLSEMFGAGQLETDAFLRTLGWRLTAEEEWEALSGESQDILNAYTEGVNAYIEGRAPLELSLEYGILTGVLNPGYRLEPWTPVHSLTWGKAMSWDLRGNVDEEITRAVLLETLTPAQLADLYPPYPADHPLIVPEIGGAASEPSYLRTFAPSNLPTEALIAVQNNVARLEALLGPSGPGIGSNSWAVSGERTASGMPLLANDPHLSIQMPSIWYQIGLHCRPKSAACPFEMAGFSFAGVPGVIIGHNDNVAWGFTNVGPDVMDLYVEKVNPQNPDQYEVNGQWVDMETRAETINVAGGEPLEITVRLTRHGPVISDTYGDLKQTLPADAEAGAQTFTEKAGIALPENYVIALKWTALEPSTPFEAIWGFNKAENWEQFRAAAAHFAVPAQNLLYADVDGSIGYQMPGNIPIRKSGDGSLPVPGWSDAYEWSGYIPFEELPYAFNPPQGYIVTANNQVPPRDYAYWITADWDYGFRAQRIVDMIESAPGPIDIAYVQQMQGDSYDFNALTYVPLLMALSLDDPHLVASRALLAEWDYQARADSAPAALFEVFWKQLLGNTFQDDLPQDYWPAGGSRWNDVLRRLADQPDSPWWDDKATADRVETRADVLLGSFTAAVSEVEGLLGKDPAKWAWGDLHTAAFENQTLGQSGLAPIENMFNRGPFRVSGGEAIVNATGWTATEGYSVDWLPSMRMVVDLGDLRNSLTVHTTGQSGHAYHPHYVDMAEMWAGIEYYPMLWNEQAIVNSAEAHLRLVP